MHIPFPERVPINRVAIFATVLVVIQKLEGTPTYFCFGCAAFILIAAFAFNTAGGLTRASGAYVFFYSILVVIIGICFKAFLGEAAQTNLQDPVTDIEVYVGGITAMYLAVFVSKQFSRKSGLLHNLLKDQQMYRASVGCIVLGAAGPYIIPGALFSVFAQLNELIPLGIITGVLYEIRRSGGTRSLNPIILAGMVFNFIAYGLLGFSKQGMLLPLLCWALPVCAQRFRISALQFVGCLAGVFVIFQYLVPYAQYGRAFVEDGTSPSQRAEIAIRLLEHPEKTRQDYKEIVAPFTSYYNQEEGFWDRLQFVSVDDGLINFTDQGHVYGFMPIEISFINGIPHVFYPNKPGTNFGNKYAREMGSLSEENESTGISFSPTAEAYHLGRWVGVFVAAPLIWFLLFVTFDSLFGDLRATPWGLLALALISHTAPEAALTGAIYLLIFGTEILLFSALFATWIAPVMASALLPRGPVREAL